MFYNTLDRCFILKNFMEDYNSSLSIKIGTMKYSLYFILVLFMSQQLLGQASKRGGYIYGWSNYSTDDLTGLGSRTVNWDSTGLVDIVHAPTTGIHPRVYFGPSEIPSIRYRLDSTVSGQDVKGALHAYTTLLHLGASYSQSQPYALNASGFRHIDNYGAWNMEPYYTKLKNQDPTVWNGVPLKLRHRTASMMALEAFMCLIYSGQNDPDVGIDYNTRAQSLATAMYHWATIVLADPTFDADNYNLFGGTHMALCYDLNYNSMTQPQRDTVRKAIARLVRNEPRHGGSLHCFVNSSNWSTLNTFEIIANLCIEGELGYNTNLTEKWMRAFHTFINYGWYPSGAGYEGLGKNYMFVTTMLACAKRGYSLLAHPHVRAYGEQFLPAIMQPFGQGFTSYDVWGGSGWHPYLGKYKFNAADAVGLKWAFPNSPKIDFMWRNYIESSQSYAPQGGYHFGQIIPDDSYNNYLLVAAMFPSDYSSGSWQSQASSVVEEDYVAMDRGLATFKSGTDADAMAIQFHARQDMGGHTHGDRLDFTMSALGRIWVRKTYGGSQFQPSRYHSMVLVDSLGVGICGRDGVKARQPATVLGHRITPELSSINADATFAYTWEFQWTPKFPQHDHHWLGTNGWQKVTETWNDFLVTPHPDPHYNIPFYDYPNWHVEGKLERLIKRHYNPMQKVVRNIGLIRGNKPMVLVVDDIQKDNSVHKYEWLGQMARDLTIDHYDVNLTDNNYKCDIIFKEPAATGNRRLLVRVLQNEGYTGSTPPGIMDTIVYTNYFNGTPFNPNPPWVRPRLIIESNSVSPNFKVLLFPYVDGDVLPVTNWNATKDTLEIVFPNETKLVRFYPDQLNNTQFELVNPSNILAVDWNSFTAERINMNQVQLDWSIEGNADNKGFWVERRFEHEDEFTTIDWVPAHGTTGLEHYDFVDDNGFEGASYYRLKQVDWDGTFTYSEYRIVYGVDRTITMNLFPNPTTDIVSVYYNNITATKAKIKIFAPNGSVVLEQTNVLLPYRTTTIGSIKDLAAGIYWVQISLDNEIERTFRVIKQ